MLIQGIKVKQRTLCFWWRCWHEFLVHFYGSVWFIHRVPGLRRLQQNRFIWSSWHCFLKVLFFVWQGWWAEGAFRTGGTGKPASSGNYLLQRQRTGGTAAVFFVWWKQNGPLAAVRKIAVYELWASCYSVLPVEVKIYLDMIIVVNSASAVWLRCKLHSELNIDMLFELDEYLTPSLPHSVKFPA